MKTGEGLAAEVKKTAVFFAGSALNKCRTVTNVGEALSHLGRNMKYIFMLLKAPGRDIAMCLFYL